MFFKLKIANTLLYQIYYYNDTIKKYCIFQGQGVQVLYVQEEFPARGGHRRQFRLHRWRCKCELYKSNTVTGINNH